jgi:hypothetical protein
MSESNLIPLHAIPYVSSRLFIIEERVKSELPDIYPEFAF